MALCWSPQLADLDSHAVSLHLTSVSTAGRSTAEGQTYTPADPDKWLWITRFDAWCYAVATEPYRPRTRLLFVLRVTPALRKSMVEPPKSLPRQMPRRQALPDDLTELCALCSAGKLFAVQEWIRTGRRYWLAEGHFTTSPLRIAIQSGFHSLVEVLLKADVSQEEKNEALLRAVIDRDLDIIELLWEYGGDVSAIDPNEVFWSRDPAIIAGSSRTEWILKVANGLPKHSVTTVGVSRDLYRLAQPDTLRTKAGRHGGSDLEFLRPRPFGTCLQLSLLV